MSVLDPDYYPESPEIEEDEENNNDEGLVINSGSDIGKNIESDSKDSGSNETQVEETLAIEKETQGISKRILVSNLEAQLRSQDKIKHLNIKIELDGNYTKDELKELLMDLPDAEGKYYLEIIGERDVE